MDITQLRYFLKTVETMNYTRAAESLFISRQALRQALSALERELGQPLFQNERNHLSLTGHGEYLFHTFGDLVRDFEEKERQVKGLFRKPIELRVAFSDSLSPYMLPGIDLVMTEFQNAHPDIALTARRLSNDQVLDEIKAGEVDCGCILQMPTPRPGCTATVLRTSGVAVSSGLDSPLNGKTELTLEELATVPLIGMGRLEELAKPLWEECQRRGLTLNYTVVPNTIDAMYLIRNGKATGFITQISAVGRVISEPVTAKADIPGYTWEVVVLCPNASPNQVAARLLTGFLKEKYGQKY